MTLSHKSDYSFSPRSRDVSRSVSEHRPTRHPAICLIGGFGFIVAMALAVHYGFAVLLG